ncbi:uncharacterized protein VTP21DRAFT_6758 [Calcarisporiella thermophila]|uniref:uncharacterized protein n=1 Tax=Calcarisporiella thermophila TaxID=911321 RepID=UPI0037422191
MLATRSLIRLSALTPALQRATPSIRVLHTEAEQKKIQRPLSPWMIYKPQLTSTLSIMHRVTGAALATGLYGVAIAYGVGPLVGAEISSETIVEMTSQIPAGLKTAGKFALAFPFCFHSLNGIRHLMWDTGRSLTVPGVYKSGYIVLAGTVLGTGYLTLF